MTGDGERTHRVSPGQSKLVQHELTGDEWSHIKAWLAAEEEGRSRPELGEQAARIAMELSTCRAAASRFLEEDASLQRLVWEGRRLGAYRVSGVLADGGMATVLLANRADGAYQKQVAIKVLRIEHADPELISRFEAERRILARLTHPWIVQMLDAGTTEEGIPYLVMEFVDGCPITEYVSQRSLGKRESLALMVEICAAVAEAHRHLTVHQDLKPGNILITRDGRVKLLDFGVARVIGDATLAAADGLTAGYASPEQVAGGPITTQSDVYAIGRILQEVLLDRLPEDDEQSWGLPGDIEAVIRKALEREVSLRYDSVMSLASDIRRYLDRRPVEARAGSWSYCFGLWAARNRRTVILFSIALLVLTLTSLSAWRAHQLANYNRIQHIAALGRMMQGLVLDLNKELSGIPELTERRRELLRRSVDRLDAETQQLGGEAAPDRELGEAYMILGGMAITVGDYADANRSMLRSARHLERTGEANGGWREKNLAFVYSSLARVHLSSGTGSEAAAFARKHVEAAMRVSGNEDEQLWAAEQLYHAAAMLRQAGAPIEAAKVHEKCFAILESVNLETHLNPANRGIVALYAEFLDRRGQHERAIRLLSREIQLVETATGTEMEALRRLYNLLQTRSRIHASHWRLQPARQDLMRAVKVARAAAEREPFSVHSVRYLAEALESLARLQRQSGEMSRAVASAGEALRMRRKMLAQSPGSRAARIEFLASLRTLGDAYLDWNPRKAMVVLEGALEAANRAQLQDQSELIAESLARARVASRSAKMGPD